MKVSDIMLDLETGDASVHDAYVQEAMGQINVSAAIYDAAEKIASLEPSEMTEVIQEAATNAGLPTDREKAIELMYAAAENVLIGTCRHLYQETAIFVEAAEKKTSPKGLIKTIAKMGGYNEPFEMSAKYADGFAKVVVGKNSNIDIKDAVFFTAKSAKSATTDLIKGFVALAQACCEDKKVKAAADIQSVSDVAGAISTSDCKECTVKFCAGNIATADKLISKANLEKTSTPNANDIKTCLYCWFATYEISKLLNSGFDAKLENKIHTAFAKADKTKPSGDCETIVKKGKDVNEKLVHLCSSLLSSFNDAFAKIGYAKNNE